MQALATRIRGCSTSGGGDRLLLLDRREQLELLYRSIRVPERIREQHLQVGDHAFRSRRFEQIDAVFRLAVDTRRVLAQMESEIEEGRPLVRLVYRQIRASIAPRPNRRGEELEH